jgi:hypothetical protein
MAQIKWDVEPFLRECGITGMARLKAAAKIIANDARRILASKIEGPPISHPPYKSGKDKGAYWTEREAGAMLKTIRVVTKNDAASRNVWIMAGTDKTWWAIQMEYGHGEWRGGARSFLRPALKNAPNTCKEIIENG